MDAPAFRIAFSTAYSNRISIYDSQSKAGCGIIDGPKLGQPTTGTAIPTKIRYYDE